MTPVSWTLLVLVCSFGAGVFGAVLGLGGGMLLVPLLTLGLKVDIRYAIGASVVSVIATSSGAAAAYVREHLTNLRVAMFLEVATSAGALTGAFLAGLIGGRWLFLIFGIVLGYSALAMMAKFRERTGEVPPDALADALMLHSAYPEPNGVMVPYRVTRTRLGLGLMYIAGTVSGLLGIGSGALKVPAMDLAMGLPLRVSSATSNFMIGVTAAASAGVYFARGDIDPFIAGPVAVGVVGGSYFGSKLLPKMDAKLLRAFFVLVLVCVAGQMLYRGIAQ